MTLQLKYHLTLLFYLNLSGWSAPSEGDTRSRFKYTSEDVSETKSFDVDRKIFPITVDTVDENGIFFHWNIYENINLHSIYQYQKFGLLQEISFRIYSEQSRRDINWIHGDLLLRRVFFTSSSVNLLYITSSMESPSKSRRIETERRF